MKNRVSELLEILSRDAPTLFSAKEQREMVDVILYGKLREDMTVSDWLKVENISYSDALEFPDAHTAMELKSSPPHGGTQMKLHGYIQSGLVFIGDPVFMAGDMSQPGSDELIDLTNPFRNWPQFNSSLGGQDVNLPFPGGALSDDTGGRGAVVQTGRMNGSYSVEKDYCPSTGKLLQIRVVMHD